LIVRIITYEKERPYEQRKVYWDYSASSAGTVIAEPRKHAFTAKLRQVLFYLQYTSTVGARRVT
jgi:hypothetical protein